VRNKEREVAASTPSHLLSKGDPCHAPPTTLPASASRLLPLTMPLTTPALEPQNMELGPLHSSCTLADPGAIKRHPQRASAINSNLEPEKLLLRHYSCHVAVNSAVSAQPCSHIQYCEVAGAPPPAGPAAAGAVAQRCEQRRRPPARPFTIGRPDRPISALFY
jgi:hypothetical protein